MKFATATSKLPSGNGMSCASPTSARTPSSRVSSTIRSDWSIATTSIPASTRRLAKFPVPQPTSSTRPGASATTSSNATSTGFGSRPAQIEKRARNRDSSAYSRRTRSGSFCGRAFIDRDLVPDLLERAADEARDVHLRDPDLLCDLGLRQPVEEPELQDVPLALIEDPEAGGEHGAVFRYLVLVLLGADRLERIEILLAVAAAAGGERERRVGAAGLERFQDLFLLRTGGLRKLRDR